VRRGRRVPRQEGSVEVILDEFAAMPLVFLFNPHVHGGATSFVFILLGFLFFRLLDITKPFGIKALEKLPGGFGIVLDDVMAAVYANLALQAGIAWLWAIACLMACTPRPGSTPRSSG
jgi:phosphatidylglycerophosphatase A